MKKRILVLLLVFALCVPFVFAQGGKEATSSNADGKTVINWWAYPTFTKVDNTAGKYEQSLVDRFEKENPDVKVNVEMLDFKNGPAKTITAINGGTAPDVLFDAPGRIVEYGTSGYLVNLTEMAKETGLDTDVSKSILEASSDLQGNVWMYPTSSLAFVMAVSKTALEEAGLLSELPKDRNWTTEEFISLSKKMAAKGYKGVEIYCGGQGGDQGTRAFISNLTGATIMNSDRSRYDMDSKAGVAAFKLVDKGVKEGWLEGNTSGNAGDALDHFTTPQNHTFWAVNLWNSNLQGAKQQQLDDSHVEVIAMNLPAVDGSPKLEYLVNGYGIFDNKDQAKIDASKRFVKFLVDNKVIGLETAKQAKCFPVRKSFGNPYTSNEMKFYDGLQKYYGAYYNTVPNFNAMRQYWFGSLQAMLTGDKTAKQAAIYYTEKANQTLID